MCGIAGIINLHQPLQNSESLLAMTKSLIHRGPDDEGYFLFSDAAKTYFGEDSLAKNTQHICTTFQQPVKVGFGFRQLKIIDLSHKSFQPMTDISKKYWIVFNGELYNYKEIKHQLIGLGHHFYSDSDTEVVLNSYKEWGEKALNKFNGMFAFAIFDIQKNTIFCARDRIGIKPFYYHKNEHHFIFGSNVQSIINSKLYTPEVDWEGLWQNFRFSTAQRPNTVYQDIIGLEPGHYLTLDLNDNSFNKVQYWEIPTNTQDFSLTEKQSHNLIEESLYNAVNYRLISDVEVGSFMSGGIDSSLISVLASKNKPDIKILTLGFKEFKELDEVQQATNTAKKHHLNHIIHYTGIAENLKNIAPSLQAYEEPYAQLSANLILAKMASQNKTTVVLSGLGGDELFGGYDVYQKISLWKKLQKNKKIVQKLPGIHHKIKKGKLLANCKTLGEYYSHYHTNYYDSEIDALFTDRTFNTTNTLETLYSNNKKFTDSFEAMSFYNLKSYIGNHQMRAIDVTTMAYSIEGRLPFLDHNFIEAAFRIPTKYKYKNKTQKYILKEIAKKYLPKDTLEMPKKGLTLPLKQWVHSDLKKFIFETLLSLKQRKEFDTKTIEKIVNSKKEAQIWQLVSTELWMQKFID
ncbi:asparagine synthase (glutamine-hydrolyzing) [Polaribacter sp.]|uniref:asparagine synthase (glutamine-hydrolyzing) n=1 Tax=Polaribacter sp. TaxID=1920175 RepID=UPI003EF90617